MGLLTLIVVLPLVGFVLNGLLGAGITGVIMEAEARHFGLLHWLLPNSPLAIVAGMLLILGAVAGLGEEAP